MTITEFIHDPEALLFIFLSVCCFAAIYMLTVPMLSGQKLSGRMKYVATERDKLRQERLRELSAGNNRVTLRTDTRGMMRSVVEHFNLQSMFSTEDMKAKLRMAGLRGQKPQLAFMFFTLVMPIIMFFLTLGYLFFLNDFGKPPAIRFIMALGAGAIGFYMPNIFVKNLIDKRQQSMQRAFPDSLDLMLICVQSGMSIEAAFGKVAHEITRGSIELAEEYTLTTAELSYLPQRHQAYDNLAFRTGLKSVKAVTTSLMQAEKYGTPVGTALRVLAQESRDERMAAAEKKAAALPPKLTVPMIVFFLPVLFLVILGPAGIQISGAS